MIMALYTRDTSEHYKYFTVQCHNLLAHAHAGEQRWAIINDLDHTLVPSHNFHDIFSQFDLKLAKIVVHGKK